MSPMTSDGTIIYKLKCLRRYDDECKVFVGYIPYLRVWTQARTEERLTHALQSAAKWFIHSCAKRGIHDRILRERGLRKTTAEGVQTMMDNGGEYIAIYGYEEISPVNVQWDPIKESAALIAA